MPEPEPEDPDDPEPVEPEAGPDPEFLPELEVLPELVDDLDPVEATPLLVLGSAPEFEEVFEFVEAD